MFVKYVGPHRGGLQQVGTLPIDIAHGEPVELPDNLAKKLLAGAPAHWKATKPTRSGASETRPELLARAAALGIEVPARATKARIVALLESPPANPHDADPVPGPADAPEEGEES